MSSMKFWGAKVKAGEPLKVEPKDFCMIHLSQAAVVIPNDDASNFSSDEEDFEFVKAIIAMDKVAKPEKTKDVSRAEQAK
ncbi:hypothetical protein SADUNF_Sadunf13G0054400 [Salix dunnii]|uniref:Uncharacterized protein n=1 Tax=Salix dunnii TaxID=1413687 RepID=A0A835JHE8_9ROSI|nr:hypothetical protein SADUNF_Sadunf13G0054400 [Salix dunnii]